MRENRGWDNWITIDIKNIRVTILKKQAREKDYGLKHYKPK